MMIRGTHTNQGSDAVVANTLSPLPCAAALALGLEQPSQLAHITKLVDAWLSEPLALLHGHQDAREGCIRKVMMMAWATLAALFPHCVSWNALSRGGLIAWLQ